MKKDKEIIKDYGEWNVPTSWDDLDLKTFQDIERFYAEKDKNFDAREVLNLFTNKSMDEINELPIEFTEKLLEKLSWVTNKPKVGEPTNKIEIDGETYSVNYQSKLKTGEYVATDAVIKSDAHNYAAILAILCRKDGEAYDSKFENEVLPSRVEMWEKQPITKVMPIVNFFLNLFMTFAATSLLYLKVEEAINLTQKNIETSHKNGELSALSTRLLKRKLKKLRKSMQAM